MKPGLLLKLLGINLPVVALVILVLWLALDTLAADYFAVLMKEYHIAPTDAHQMFVLAIHRYLLWASSGALVVAAVLSFLLTQRVLRPLYQMIETARLISAGDYTSRVRSASGDEIGELAAAFNHMAQSLERIERLRRDMVSDVAHELRTPLTNIRGYLEALQDGVVAPTQDTFELLLGESLRLVHLVEDLLQLARADAARTTLILGEVDFPVLIARILKGFELKFREKQLQVATEFDATVGQVMADRNKLSQVIENLLKNALQYTPEGGKVAIRVDHAGRAAKFTIENSGSGIADEDLPLIFERFYRGEKSRSRDYGGTGIGLAIVKELVEAQRGEVGVESSPGATRFWFTLPL
jgi:two-component system, OmpR family, sensor histidine kinase BaeS